LQLGILQFWRPAQDYLSDGCLSEPARLVAFGPLLVVAQRLLFVRAVHASAASPCLCRADDRRRALSCDLRSARPENHKSVKSRAKFEPGARLCYSNACL